MGTNCAPLVADLFWLSLERHLSDYTQADIVEALSSISRYLDDRLIIDILTLKISSLRFILQI